MPNEPEPRALVRSWTHARHLLSFMLEAENALGSAVGSNALHVRLTYVRAPRDADYCKIPSRPSSSANARTLAPRLPHAQSASTPTHPKFKQTPYQYGEPSPPTTNPTPLPNHGLPSRIQAPCSRPSQPRRRQPLRHNIQTPSPLRKPPTREEPIITPLNLHQDIVVLIPYDMRRHIQQTLHRLLSRHAVAGLAFGEEFEAGG